MIRKVYPFTKKQIVQYICVLVTFASVIYYVMIVKEQFLFSLYFFSLIGMFFWLEFIFNKKYLFKPITLVIFIAKFIANFVANPVYWGKAGIATDVSIILLTLLDMIFIVVYFIRKGGHHHAEDFKN